MNSLQSSNKENINLFTPSRKLDTATTLQNHDGIPQVKKVFGNTGSVAPINSTRKALGHLTERNGQQTPAPKTQHRHGIYGIPTTNHTQYKQSLSTAKQSMVFRENQEKDYGPVEYMPLIESEEFLKPEIEIDLEALLAPKPLSHNALDKYSAFDKDLTVTMDTFNLDDDLKFFD